MALLASAGCLGFAVGIVGCGGRTDDARADDGGTGVEAAVGPPTAGGGTSPAPATPSTPSTCLPANGPGTPPFTCSLTTPAFPSVGAPPATAAVPALFATQPGCSFVLRVLVGDKGPTVCTYASPSTRNRLVVVATKREGTQTEVGGYREACVDALDVGVETELLMDVARCGSAASGSIHVRLDAPDGGPPTRVTVRGGFDTSSGTSRCSSPDVLVATPNGERPMGTLAAGDLVYSADDLGFVVVPITRVKRLPVTKHHVVRLELASGATVEMSPEHPLPRGRVFRDLVGARSVDGVALSRAAIVPYAHPFTMDILPASSTGTYVAAGLVVGSTLADDPSRRRMDPARFSDEVAVDRDRLVGSPSP